LVSHLRGRTVIAVAHRLSTLNSFDRIIVLDRAGIVEEGAVPELLRRNGIYRQMYESQRLDPRHP
jgi:ATP-binding cassette, subfamily B, bacterial